MNVALYIRVSTQEQAKEGYSIGEQTERLEKYAQAHGWTVFKKYTDPGYSGANMQRPALKQLIQDAKSHKFEKVIVYKLDRLSRSQKDTLMIIEDILLKNDVDFVSMNENFDTSTPFGKAMIGILAVFAQLEREQIKERMKMGKEARAKEGKFNGGGGIPYGYEYSDGRLIVNDYEAMVIKKIFDLANEGKAAGAIAGALTRAGYKPKKGSWNDSSVRKMIESKVYIGFLKYQNKWYKGDHDPIIDIDQFEAVQDIIRKRKSDYKTKNIKPGRINSTIGGLIFCARCGSKYYKNTKTQRRGEKVYRHEDFACMGRLSHGDKRYKDIKCDNKIWKVDELTNIIYDEILKLSSDPEYFEQVKQDPEKYDDILAIRSEILKVDAQISKLVDLYSMESMPMDVIKSKMEALNKRKEDLGLELAAAENEKNREKDLKKIKKTIKKIPEILKNGSDVEIHAMISELITKIEIDGEDISIYWNF